MGTKYPWQEALEERIRASENEEPKKPAWQERLEAKIQQEKNAQALAYAQETAGSSQKAGEYIVNQVNDLIAQNTQAVTAAQQRYANRKNTPEDAYVADSGTYFETLTQQQDLLYSQANEILDYLSSVENLFDKEWVSSVRKTVQAVQLQQAQMVINAENDSAYWKQWENADAYKLYQDQWNHMQMLQNMDTEAEEQKRVEEYNAVETKIAELQKMRADAYKAAVDGSLPKEQTEALWAKVDRLDQRIAKLAARSDYLYMDRPAEIYNAQMYQKFGTLQSNTDWAKYSQQVVSPDRGIIDALNFNEEQNIYEALTEEEKKEYSYVYNKMGKEAAQEYLKYKSYAANARRMQGVQEWAQKFANDVPVLSDIASIPMNLVSGIGYLDLLGQEAKNLITGEYRPLDYNTMAMAPSVGASGIRGQRAQNIQEALKNSELLAAFGIDENTRDVLGQGAGGFYQLGMSMADSAAVAALGKVGVPPAVGTTFLAGSAATQGVRDAVARGASDEQALASGFMSGLFEWFFEKHEIDELIGAIKNGKMSAVVRQAIIEGCGEGATSVANIVADAFIMKENSNWDLLRQQYKDSGMSDDMATLNAFKDMAIQVGMDTLGGMLMGGLSTGGGIAISKATNAVKTAQNNYQVGKTIIQKAGGVEGLKNLAGSVSETATDSKAKEKIEKLAGKVTDKGGVHIANQINTGKLFSAIRDVAAQHSTEELAKNLSEKGFDTERATQIAEAVRAVTTKKATAQQVKMLGQALADSNVAQAIMEVSEKPSAEVGSVKEFAQQMTADEQIDQGGETVNPNIQNGGTENASTYEQADADGTGSGTSVLYGSGQRNVGTGTGEQTGSVASGAGQNPARKQAAINRLRTQTLRANIARNLSLPKVSSLSLGVKTGTQRENLQEIPREHWDEGMTAKAEQVYQETGLEVRYVVGSIQITGTDGRTQEAKGVKTENSIIVRVDHGKLSAEQIADHEAYHGMRSVYGQRLNQELIERIREQYTEEEFRPIVEAYVEALRGTIDVEGTQDGEEFEKRMWRIYEEILADAHAGVNAFGVEASRFTKTVNAYLDENGISRKPGQENGVRQTNGPNAEQSTPDAYQNTDSAEQNTQNAEWEARITEILSSVSSNHAAQFERYTQLTKENPEQAAKESERLSRGIYGELFDEYRQLTEQRDRAKENTAKIGGERYSIDAMQRTIYPGMDDAQRTAILMNKEIYAPIYDSTHPITGAQILKLKGMYVTEARSLLTEIARQCGDFQSDLHNADIDLSFAYSNKSLKESVNKQSKRGGGAESFGKMLTILPEICETAVEIEAHTDRYVDTARADGNLKEMHVLVGAFMDGNDCIPVQLEIKEYKPEAGLKNKLYVTVTMKNEAGVTPRISNANVASENARSRPASVISLADMIANVKDNTGGLVKYLPDQMLTEEQQKSKQKALAEDETRIGDMRYAYAVAQGNQERAERMLRVKASEAGYSAEDDWRMAHRAPNREQGVTLDRADEVYGGDGSIYSPLAHRLYGEGRSYDIKAIMAIYKAWSDPEGSVMVYRAVPTDVKDTNLRNGDWVTPTKEYAKEHGERTFDIGFRVIEQQVPVKHLYLNGDSIHEFGYDNGRNTEVYRNTKNNVKLSEVTYDDAGNLIPLSQRYNIDNADERYSIDEDGTETVSMEQVEQELGSEKERWEEMWLKDRLGEEGYAEYQKKKKAAEVEQREKKKAAETEQREKFREKQKAKSRERRERIKSRTQELIDSLTQKSERQTAKDKPTKAKARFRRSVMDLFSIPDGQKASLLKEIDSYADRILEKGRLTEADRKFFFDRLYRSGVMEVPVDDYHIIARDMIKNGRIYVDEHIRADFGDDWAAFRRRAFAAGIYLTDKRTDPGVDQWNATLAQEDMLAGLFDSEETDGRWILEKIVQTAEDGKSESMSLAEYTADLAEQGYIRETEFLEEMEAKLDELIRTFASNAQIELAIKENKTKQGEKERKEIIKQKARLAAEREERRQELQRQRDQKELQELQQKTLKSLQWLKKNRNLAPEELREKMDEVLGDIDLYAIHAANEMNWSKKYQATWKDVVRMYDVAKAQGSEGFNFLPTAELDRIVSRLRGDKLEDMDVETLQDLFNAAVGLRTEMYNRKNMLNDEWNRLMAEVYTDSKDEIQSVKKGIRHNPVEKFFNTDMLTPMNVLERMGGWNPNGAFYSMAKQLEQGERDVRAYRVKAQQMLAEFLTENQEWVKKADGQGKDAIWYELEVPELLEFGKGDKPIFGDTVKVQFTPAQKVHMYLESKNTDNLRHMCGGRTFADKELYSKGKRQEAFTEGHKVRLAPETVKQMVSSLSDEERALADILEKYYNEFAKGEINRVSNILYGYDKALTKHYAPIYTDNNYVQKEIGIFDVTAEGVGSLKGRIPYAKNPSYNIGAFDAFERHVGNTSKFCGWSIPMRNWKTLLNWQEENTSMRAVIAQKWGKQGTDYIDQLLKDLQSKDVEEKTEADKLADVLMNRYITAVFGMNPSIVLKQWGSVPLAGAYLGIENGPSLRHQVFKIDRELISKYTKELDWRLLGYATPETKTLKDNPSKLDTNKFTQFTMRGGAITAMDGTAASMLWPWAENKVRREYPELEAGTQEQIDAGESPFYKAVAKEFDNALTKSQSVSDDMHQSRFRKSKNNVARTLSLFRSDSAQQYNTLRQMIGEAVYAKKNGKSTEVIKKANRAVGAVVLAILRNAVWAELVGFGMAFIKNGAKYYKDDEEQEVTPGSAAQEMGLNMLYSLLGLIPGAEELAEAIGHAFTGEEWYPPETMGLEQIVDVAENCISFFGGIVTFFAGANDVAENGGDVGQYWAENYGQLLGAVKDGAKTFATYYGGIPADNMEKYILGMIRLAFPGFVSTIDDQFQNVNKGTLTGSSGAALESKVSDLFVRRGATVEDETAKQIARLYESGYTEAVPSDIPESVTVDGEKHEFDTAQQQKYGEVWAEVAVGLLDQIVSSDRFAEADDQTRAKILEKVYDYATEQAKAELIEEFETGKTTDELSMFEDAGMDASDYFSVKAQGYNPKKYAEAVSEGLPEQEADALLEEIEALEPLAGKESVETVQKWRTCVDMFGNPDVQLAALAAYMDDGQYRKAKIAREFDVDLSAYVKLFEIRSEFDADGNKSYSSKEYKEAIDSLGLSRNDRAVLWQLATGAKSSKNNPYNSSVGKKVIDTLTV